MAMERSIIDAAARLRRAREPHLVATVVRVLGAAYRRPGARMLLTQFRWISGSLSGGSLEDDIATKGWALTRSGEPIVITYDGRAPVGLDQDTRAAFGLGCDGAISVMLERAGTPGRIDPLEFAAECVRRQRRGAIVTAIRSEAPGIRMGARVALIAGDEPRGDRIDVALRAGMIADARAAIATGESCNRTYRSDSGNVDVFVEAILPPPRVFVFGASHEAVPLVTIAKSLGWDVSVCAGEERVSMRQRFAAADEILVGTPSELAARIDECDRAVAVVMGHDYAADKASLTMLIGTRARYIGVLGPRARTQRILSEVGLGLHLDSRIHSPLGLEMGAETPQEVALAITAEIQAELSRVSGLKLRDRLRSIQERGATVVMPRVAEAVANATPVSPVTGTMKRITDRIEALAPVAS